MGLRFFSPKSGTAMSLLIACSGGTLGFTNAHFRANAAINKTTAPTNIKRKGRTLRFRKCVMLWSIVRSGLRGRFADFCGDQKCRNENQDVRQVDENIAFQGDVPQM